MFILIFTKERVITEYILHFTNQMGLYNSTFELAYAWIDTDIKLFYIRRNRISDWINVSLISELHEEQPTSLM